MVERIASSFMLPRPGVRIRSSAGSGLGFGRRWQRRSTLLFFSSVEVPEWSNKELRLVLHWDVSPATALR